MRKLLRRRSRDSERGQAMTEFAILAGGLLIGSAVLINWAPDTMNMLHIYMMGIYYIVGTPLG